MEVGGGVGGGEGGLNGWAEGGMRVWIVYFFLGMC